jgi:hypothetical protein
MAYWKSARIGMRIKFLTYFFIVLAQFQTIGVFCSILESVSSSGRFFYGFGVIRKLKIITCVIWFEFGLEVWKFESTL